MKQTLQLKLTQHLTLTPQLQQSIRLLQLSTLELNAEVERMLQENPLLERAEAEEEVARAEESRPPPDDAPESTDFTDYSSGGADGEWGGSGASEDDDFYPQQVATSTLRDHLNEQLAQM